MEPMKLSFGALIAYLNRAIIAMKDCDERPAPSE